MFPRSKELIHPKFKTFSRGNLDFHFQTTLLHTRVDFKILCCCLVDSEIDFHYTQNSQALLYVLSIVNAGCDRADVSQYNRFIF